MLQCLAIAKPLQIKNVKLVAAANW